MFSKEIRVELAEKLYFYIKKNDIVNIHLFDLVYDDTFDYVLTHTCPYNWRPTDLFMKSVDQSKVDNTTEKQLQYLASIIAWHNWYWGHFHGDRDYGDGRRMFYNDIVEI